MQFVITLIALAAACASAQPVTGYEPASEPASSGQTIVCQQNQVSACCNKKSAEPLLGLDCTPISVAIVGAAGIFSPACSTEQKPACCEQGAQTGTFNVDAQCMFANEI